MRRRRGRYTAASMSRRPSGIRLAHLVIGGLLLISIAHALSRHLFDPSRPRGIAALLLVTLTAIVALGAAIARRRSRRVAMVTAGVVCVSALQVVAPEGGFSLLLYIAAAGVGATVPRRWVWAAIAGSIVLVSVLALLARPTGSVSDLLTVAFSLAVSVGLTNTLVDLRRNRDERERLYAELSRAHVELRQYAVQAEELAELRERARLARELHDTLGHALTTLTVHLEAIERAARARPASVGPLLEDARGLSRRAMNDLRDSLADLRGDPGSRPLAEQLRSLAGAAAARAGWRLELALDPVDVPRDARHALVRITREALANVERHAHARRVTLALRSVAQGVELKVTDDGTGFDPDAVDGGHFGLRGMRERAELLGATLEVSSARGSGTQVRLAARYPSPRKEVATP